MNPYEVLEVPVDADAVTIKKAYRKKAQKMHPDKNNGDSEQFQRVQKSYEVLSDPAKRKLFDETGSMDDTSHSDAILHTTFGNIFIELATHQESEGYDLMEMAKRTANHVQNESKKKIMAMELRVNKLNDTKSRVGFHGKGQNVLHMAIDNRIRDAEQQIAQSKLDLAFGERLLALMDDYTYKGTKKEQHDDSLAEQLLGLGFGGFRK